MNKKFLLLLGIVATIVAIAIGIGKYPGKSPVESNRVTPQEIEKELIQGLGNGAKQLKTPMMVDEDTRLEKVTVGPGPRVTYHYTIVKHPSQKIDPSILRRNLYPEIRNKVCTGDKMKVSLQYGATYTYSYSGNDGVHVGSVDIDRDVCGLPKISP